jgi:hypothetical protein
MMDREGASAVTLAPGAAHMRQGLSVKGKAVGRNTHGCSAASHSGICSTERLAIPHSLTLLN